jgi:hypothetical protein
VAILIAYFNKTVPRKHKTMEIGNQTLLLFPYMQYLCLFPNYFIQFGKLRYKLRTDILASINKFKHHMLGHAGIASPLPPHRRTTIISSGNFASQLNR